MHCFLIGSVKVGIFMYGRSAGSSCRTANCIHLKLCVAFTVGGCCWIIYVQERNYLNPTEIIDLKVYSSVKSSEDITNKAYSFDVYSNNHAFSMLADSAESKEGDKIILL